MIFGLIDDKTKLQQLTNATSDAELLALLGVNTATGRRLMSSLKASPAVVAAKNAISVKAGSAVQKATTAATNAANKAIEAAKCYPAGAMVDVKGRGAVPMHSLQYGEKVSACCVPGPNSQLAGACQPCCSEGARDAAVQTFTPPQTSCC